MLIAKYTKPNRGDRYDKQQISRFLTLGEKYSVNCISMGQSHTSIYLTDFPHIPFNSIFFDFEEDGKEINIFVDERYNPYIRK